MKYLSILLLALSATLLGQETGELFSESTFQGLELRNIGPAFTSGRIADIAIHPDDESIWYVAVGSAESGRLLTLALPGPRCLTGRRPIPLVV